MSEHNHLLFSAGGLSLAVASSSVHCIHDGLATQSETGTADWFLGVAVADERLLPVTDLGLYLYGEVSTGRVLEVSRNLGIAGLKIDEVHGVSKNRSELFSRDLTTAHADVALQSLAVNDLGQQFQIIDFASLLQASRFLNVHSQMVSKVHSEGQRETQGEYEPV